jgi:hypothetical protein
MKKKLFGGKETVAEERKEAKSGKLFGGNESAAEERKEDKKGKRFAEGGIVPASKLSDSDRFKRQVAGAKADMSAIDKSPYDVPSSAPPNKLEAKVDAVNATTALTKKSADPVAKPVKSESRKSSAPTSKRRPSESNASRAARQAAYDSWVKTNRGPMTKLYEDTKAKKYAKGGMVKGDGCASSGRTKGRMV